MEIGDDFKYKKEIIEVVELSDGYRKGMIH